MHIGIPKEIKAQEFRVGLTPAGVKELTAVGHTVAVERAAGAAIGFTDDSYRRAGASICTSADEIFAHAKLIVKVKEPQPDECEKLSAGQILFTYLHLAADRKQTKLLLQSQASCIAYETVSDASGALPLLTPMSEIAGKLAVQAAARCLENPMGGRGLLMGGVPGVGPANVLVIGGGVVGLNAARVAMGMGAKVSVVDRSLTRLKVIDELFGERLTTLFSHREVLEQALASADVIIGAVLIPGGAAPKLISKSMLSIMQSGAVFVDVAIDQGGCSETSRPTTHAKPTYVVDNIVHYCVANIPGAVALTASQALTNASLPFVMMLAERGIDALADDPYFLQGLNIHAGQLTCKAVADAQGLAFLSPDIALAHR